MNRKRMRAAAIVMTLILAVMMLAGCGAKKDGDAAAAGKNVTIEVVSQDGSSVSYDVATEQEFLKGAMDELAEGGEFSYEEENGMVMTVNGVTADYEKDQAYWAIYVNDEFGQYGIADQPLADGDTYKLEYTPAQ